MTPGQDEFALIADRGQLDSLSLDGFRPLTRLGNHPGFSLADHRHVLRCDLGAALARGSRVWALHAGGQPVAIGTLVAADQESAHFGRAMARLILEVAAPLPPESLARLIGLLLVDARQSAISHLAAEVPVDRLEVSNALARAGFLCLDVRSTCFVTRPRPRPEVGKFRATIRPYRPADRAPVMAMLAATDFQTRFTRDPSLPERLARDMYRRWLETLLDDPAALVLVCEREGIPVGCGAIGERDLAVYGFARKVRAGSLYLSSAAGHGAYAPVLLALAESSVRSHGSAETTISLANTAALRVLEAVGFNRPPITTMAMHLALDAP